VRVLVVNAGSTSLKLAVVDEADSSAPVASLADVPPGVGAVGHRIVHGGTRFRDPVVLEDDVVEEVHALVDLAPLHNAPALAALADARLALPEVPHVGVFDTAFHATLPEEAYTYALPLALRDERGIRRFGFHGLSVQWAAEHVRVPRLVVCHLGGGCSVTAVRDGRSVDTSMGFTPLEGVPMATRAGSVDPGILTHLLRGEMPVEGLEELLEHRAGLAGVSGISGNVAELESAGTHEAGLALTLLARGVAKWVAGAATVLGGIDALVFTAGIGERSARVRADVCARLAVLGVELDQEANASCGAQGGEIGAREGAVRVSVVPAREDVVVARAVRLLLAA
jgi:acetate kinase